MENFNAIDLHQTRDFGRKVNATFEFLKQNFKSLGKSIIYISGPPILIAGLLMGSLFGDMMDFSTMASDPDAMLTKFTSINFWMQIVLVMVFYIVASVTTLATLNNYFLLYDEKKSNKIEVGEVWQRVQSNFWIYLGTMFLITLLMGAICAVMVLIVFVLGTLAIALGVLAGIAAFFAIFYFIYALSFVFIIRTYEKTDFFGSISRSYYLIRGKWWSTFGLILILYMIAGTISYIFMIPVYALTFISAFHSVESGMPTEPSTGAQALTVTFLTLYYLSQMILYSLPNVGIAFQYFNLVERKESRSLLNQIDTIGQPASPAAPADEQY